ncbi:D-2-hydroxyacid dehydrogenase [Fervidibacillus halotolerans]|uniref:D-2-hydroxyacid dehydrogenase n=1 Tax=Fervidibacillus halotolerans TaxID=2980027 RepID=A0A9E8M052_9BACI|nr:D-2-hydroxyacid dehydrogenase [Fervidibacillus halotolerans]WAA12940.1 D-2-hydroxyacid dehydrogenase [Fervidibacillus halotolerans]
MDIVASFNRREALQRKIIDQFPNLNFFFYKNMKELGSHIERAEVLVTYGEDVTDEIILKAKNLKWIMVISAGLEKMPFKIVKEKGILVTNARGIHKIPMAEMAIGYLLQYTKRFRDFDRQQRETVWNRRLPLTELFGRKLLIVGAGAIGSQIAKYAKVFGMKTIGINRSGKPVPSFDEIYVMEQLNEVLSKADFVLSVLPSTEFTRGIFGKEQFQLMKKEAVFINMGRGDAVNETELIEALKEDELAHAFLDVFQTEPLPKNHPFWKMDKITITPHVSAITPEYLPRAFEIFSENLARYLEGKRPLINEIDLSRGY